MRNAVLAVLALLLALPATASAATVKARGVPKGDFIEGRAKFVAARGEANRLTISRGRSGRLRFRDRSNPVRARGFCRQVDRHTASCSPDLSDSPLIRLRNRPDRVSDRSGEDLTIRGGRGGDRLSVDPLDGDDLGDDLYGGAGADVLVGGPDDDRITGGPGSDTVSGGDGQDTLIDGETDGRAAPDSYDGGPNPTPFNYNGGDSLDYRERRKGLRIDLASGQTSTEDQIAGVEDLVGGRGDDTLAGDDGDNLLDGRGGDDTLAGRGGADFGGGGSGDDHVSGEDGDDNLRGGAGEDALAGGDGDDYLISHDDESEPDLDRLDCGDGADTASSDERDTLDAECEIVAASYLEIGTVPALTDADSADFAVNCTGNALKKCAGTLALSGPSGQDFGSARYSLPREATGRTISVALTPAGKAALASGKVVVVKPSNTAPVIAPGPGETGGYRIFLKR